MVVRPEIQFAARTMVMSLSRDIYSDRPKIKYIDLARAKIEALDNICSLFKQTIKSQRQRTVKNNNRSN